MLAVAVESCEGMRSTPYRYHGDAEQRGDVHGGRIHGDDGVQIADEVHLLRHAHASDANMGNRLVRSSINALFSSRIKDIMTGYRAFSFQFVKSFPVLSRGFEIETEMSIHAVDKNMSVDNVVIDYRDRPQGSVSKLNTISDGLSVLKTIFDLWRNYRPFHFFTVLAAVLTVIDALVFIPVVLVPYIRTGLVPNFPTLIVCGFVMVAALMAFFNGMVLDAIIKKEKREYEFRLQLLESMRRRQGKD